MIINLGAIRSEMGDFTAAAERYRSSQDHGEYGPQPPEDGLTTMLDAPSGSANPRSYCGHNRAIAIQESHLAPTTSPRRRERTGSLNRPLPLTRRKPPTGAPGPSGGRSTPKTNGIAVSNGQLELTARPAEVMRDARPSLRHRPPPPGIARLKLVGSAAERGAPAERNLRRLPGTPMDANSPLEAGGDSLPRLRSCFRLGSLIQLATGASNSETRIARRVSPPYAWYTVSFLIDHEADPVSAAA